MADGRTSKRKTVTVKGTVEKVVQRDIYRLLLKTEGRGVIADFNEPPVSKIRKGATVEIVGRRTNEGYATICLSNCRFID